MSKTDPYVFVDDSIEILEDVLVRVEHFNKKPEQRMNIWRGQPDSEYELVPSIFRENMQRRILDFLTIIDIHDEEGRYDFKNTLQAVEYDLIRNFIISADQAGVQPPGLNLAIRSAVSAQYKVRNWPFDDMMSAAAIAQHHGIPTRLLDWSYHALTALYFALDGWLDLIEDKNTGDLKDKSEWPDNIALFKMDVTDLVYKLIFSSDSSTVILPGEPVQLIQVPHTNNKYMQAQGGVFTMPTDIIVNDWNGTKLGIEHISSDLTPIVKYIIPSRLLLKLNNYLSTTRHFGTHLLPSYSGSRKSMRQISKFRKVIVLDEHYFELPEDSK